MTSEEILLEQYKLIIQQVLHWDVHFWEKSKFFLAIETAFMGVAGAIFLKPEITSGVSKQLALCTLLLLCIFNIYLCIVWYKTNNRNRGYLRLKIHEMKQIEARLPELFSVNPLELKLKMQPYASSAGWEVHLATGFGFLWTLFFSICLAYLVGLGQRS